MSAEKQNPAGSLQTLVGIALANQNAIHTLISHKVERGEMTKAELDDLDLAMSSPMRNGLIPEGELTEHIRNQHDEFFDQLKRKLF